MTLEETVLQKIQEILGENYELNLGNAFDRRYTIPTRTPDGVVNNINYQAFEDKKDMIVGVLTIQPTDYNVVDYLSYNTTYTLQLWYALDNYKVDKFGIPIGDLPTDIDADLETLRTTLSGSAVEFSEDLRGWMTFATPVRATAYDNTGTGKRGVLTLNGKINLTDKGIFGSDRVIKLGLVEGEATTYYAIPNKRQYTVTNGREAPATQVVGAKRPTLDGQSNGNSLVVSYDNYTDATKPLLAFLENIALGITATDENYTIPVQIYKGETLQVSYNAIIDVNISNQNGETGTEVVTVTLKRSE